MRKTILASALLVFAQSAAHAQLMDLPDPGDMGSLPASETQAPVEHPPIQQGASFASSLRISSVSRATSGAFYNVAIQALTLSTLDLRATTRIKVYNVILKTSEGRSIEAREFRNGVFVEAGSVVSAGNLNLNEAVIEILIQAACCRELIPVNDHCSHVMACTSFIACYSPLVSLVAETR